MFYDLDGVPRPPVPAGAEDDSEADYEGGAEDLSISEEDISVLRLMGLTEE